MERFPKKQAAVIMIQGTASHVGKSMIATAFCRIFTRHGYRTAPFKSWNMSVNTYLTADGGEIGVGQGQQAEAARIKATVEMNPLLIKPVAPGQVQVIVRGRPYKSVDTAVYAKEKQHDFYLQVIAESLARLCWEYEIVVIEGAGSPAEINLQEQDVANMQTAHLAKAPVLLVGDFSRNGALAGTLGTYLLLPPKDRALLGGFLFNKFDGEEAKLQLLAKVLTAETKLPVLGAIPYLKDLTLAEEDVAKEKALRGEEVAEKKADSGRQYDLLADAVEKALEMPQIYHLMGLAGPRKESGPWVQS
ncbi:MAG: cobyric acid synthase [Firmicutes bacterium]|nr:cobyric acid synthase [Bacillota bacterium]